MTVQSKSPLQIFDQALMNGTVIDQREKDYGPAPDQMRVIQRMNYFVANCADEAIRHCLEMINVKIARLVNNPSHVDSAVDIAGYARIIAQCQTQNSNQYKE